MSFILEALRKSESDRQRLGSVAIADLPIARRHRGQPWWVFALSGLLLLNLIVLSIVLLRDKTTSRPSVSTSTSPSMTTVAPARTIASNPTAAVSEPQRVAAAPVLPAAINPLQEAAAPAAQIDYETVPRSELENAGASVPDGPTLVRSVEATRNEANSQVASAQAAQDLHIDLHVYSPNARERFVLINMRRYTEGQQLPNGAVVEQITPEGAVLLQNGTRYQLTR